MTCLDLFAGAGGASEGLHRAGYRHIACVEWDPDACAVLRAVGLPTVEADASTVDWSPWAGRVDLLWASPPCQAWSLAGKRRGAADERNLWPATLAALDALRPTWAICENVPGLLYDHESCDHAGRPTCCPGRYWHEWVVPQFARRFPWAGWRVLDAADYGVPQHRRRVFLVGGPVPYVWPEPTHADPRCPTCQGIRTHDTALFGALPCAPCLGTGQSEEVRTGRRQRWRTVRDALGLDAWGTETGFSGSGRPREPRSADEPACQPIAGGKALGGLLAFDSSAPTIRAQSSVDASGHQGGHAAPLVAIEREDPCRGWETADRPGNAVSCRHPAYLLDAPGPTVRSGGDGHAPPPAYVVLESGSKCRRGADGAPADALQAGSPTSDHAPLVATEALPAAASRPELLDAPSPTVTGQEVRGTRASPSSGGAFHGGPDRASDVAFLGAGVRRLSVEECAAIQAFPPDWPWDAATTKTAAYRCVGNAVPPPVAEALARAVLAAQSSPSPVPDGWASDGGG